MKYNERIINKFGILSYEVGCAVTPDYTVLALPCEDINDVYVSSLMETVKYRNGMALDSLCISNIHINDENAMHGLPISYNVMPNSYVDQMHKDYTLPSPAIFKSNCRTDLDRLAETICDQLSGNIRRIDIDILTQEVASY